MSMLVGEIEGSTPMITPSLVEGAIERRAPVGAPSQSRRTIDMLA
jgi:hypothetical protein